MSIEAYSFAEKTITTGGKKYPMKIIGMYDLGRDVWTFGADIQNFAEDIVHPRVDKYDEVFDVMLCCKLIASESEGTIATLYHDSGFVVFFIPI